MVQPLPGFLDLCLDVCSPCQVLGDVYTEVLEAAHPLHRGPADHKRSVGLQLSLPEVEEGINFCINLYELIFTGVPLETKQGHGHISRSVSAVSFQLKQLRFTF